MVFAAFGILMLLIAWFKGYLKSWKEFYSTTLFVIIGNESCDLLLCKKPLWEYTDFFGQYMLTRILMMFILYSGTVIIFLARFPKKIKSVIAYIIIWTLLYAAVEEISLLLRLFSHLNGWNILYTIIHNLVMFLLIALHQKKPLPAWILSFLTSIAVLLIFKIPFTG